MKGQINIKILVAPLDWGLGHACRCIPLIHHLTALGCTVIIASEGMQRQLLQPEFPGLQFIDLKGYRITYSKNKRWFAIKIFSQLPKIIKSFIHENTWLKHTVKHYDIDAIVSDNRYGLYHKKIASIFLTHQLNIKAPAFLERCIQRINYFFINRFSACWVPDTAGHLSLAGKLSHPRFLPAIPVHYINGLSRFQVYENIKQQYDVLIVISGPEPQRSMLEKKLLNDLKDYKGAVLFVRGLPGCAEKITSNQNVGIVNHLNSHDLNFAFQQSGYIISRSGYTTVMDLMKLKKKSILIPTPKQTEQEYLADHLLKQQWALCYSQHDFHLETALREADQFAYSLPELNMEEYKIRVNEFVTALQNKKHG